MENPLDKWKSVGGVGDIDPPNKDAQIYNEKLCDGLKEKRRFTQAEFDSFNVRHFRKESWVKIRNKKGEYIKLVPDPEGFVKVYVPLQGELEEVTIDNVEADFKSRSMTVTVSTPKALHRIHIPELSYPIVPKKCKTRVTKSRKLIISLAKLEPTQAWWALGATQQA